MIKFYIAMMKRSMVQIKQGFANLLQPPGAEDRGVQSGAVASGNRNGVQAENPPMQDCPTAVIKSTNHPWPARKRSMRASRAHRAPLNAEPENSLFKGCVRFPDQQRPDAEEAAKEALHICKEQLSAAVLTIDELKSEVQSLNSRCERYDLGIQSYRRRFIEFKMRQDVEKAVSDRNIRKLKHKVAFQKNKLRDTQLKNLNLIAAATISTIDLKILTAETYIKDLTRIISRRDATLSLRNMRDNYEALHNYVIDCMEIKISFEDTYQRLSSRHRQGIAIDMEEMEIDLPNVPQPCVEIAINNARELQANPLNTENDAPLPYSELDGPPPLLYSELDGPPPLLYSELDGPPPLLYSELDGPPPLLYSELDGPPPLLYSELDGPPPLHYSELDGPPPLLYSELDGPPMPPYSELDGPPPPPYSELDGPPPPPYSELDGPPPAYSQLEASYINGPRDSQVPTGSDNQDYSYDNQTSSASVCMSHFSIEYQTPSVSGYQTPSVSGYQTPSVSGYQTPSVSGYQTPSASGYQTPFANGYQTPSASGYQTPSVCRYPTPSASGYQTPSVSGYKTPSASGV